MKTYDEYLLTVALTKDEQNFGRCVWQACAAEYQPQLEELRKLLQEVLELYPQEYRCEPGSYGMVHINPMDWVDVKGKIEAVLDRSGARGGSVAGQSEPSLDNPPADMGRGRTE